MKSFVKRDKPTQRKLILQCDTKEDKNFITLLKKHAEKHIGPGRIQEVSMPHFDYRWVIDDGNANDENKMQVFGYGVEHKKATSDLPSSVVDGRWYDQKARIRRNGMKPWNVAFLFEGDCTQAYAHYPNSLALVNAENNTALRDGFNIVITPSMANAITWLIDTHLYLEQVEDDGKSEGTFYNPDYVVGLHKQQKYYGESKMASLMASVRGCSPPVAKAIASKYPEFSDLVNAVGELTRGGIDPRGILQDIPVPRGKKTKRLGYVLSERIIMFYDMCNFKGQFKQIHIADDKPAKKRKVVKDESSSSSEEEDDYEDDEDDDDPYGGAPDGNFMRAAKKIVTPRKWTNTKKK